MPEVINMNLVKIKDFFKNPEKYINLKEKVFLIGVAGGSGSGKTFVANKIALRFDAQIISTDNYYKPLAKEFEHSNMDIPEAVDLDLLREHLIELKAGRSIQKPIYDFKTHLRIGKEEITPSKAIIIEGIFALNEIFSEILDFKVFVDCPEKMRFKRRLERDIRERGRDEKGITKRWREEVEPSYKKFIEPQKADADIIIDSSEDLKVNISKK